MQNLFMAFVLYHFRIFASIEAVALCSIVRAPTATRSYIATVCTIVCVLLCFCFILFRGKYRFFRLFLYDYRFHLPNGVLLPCDPGPDF